MPSGMIVHSSSSASEPWIATPTSSSLPAAVLDREDDDQDGDQQREERRDRHHEEVDAVDLRRLLGRLRREERQALKISVNIVRFGARGQRSRACVDWPASARSRRRLTVRNIANARIVATPADAHQRQDACAVLSGRRVVVVAEQQHVIDRPCRCAPRTPRPGRAAVARREFDPVEVLAIVPFGVEHLDGRAVRVLLDLRVVRVAEADRVGQRDRWTPASRSGSASRPLSAAGRSAPGSSPSSATPGRGLPSG